VGGVALGLGDESALLASYKKMVKKFAKHKPGFVLQEHLPGGKEVIVGSKSNEGLAPTVMFGLGGVFVEVLKDVQFRLAPLSREEAVDMILSIKGYPILEGTRGEKAVDIDGAVDILLRLSELGADFPQLDEMDLNPVLVFPKGKGAAVVDARMKYKPV
jgi:acyl-CoA synthetase (NDP forming)